MSKRCSAIAPKLRASNCGAEIEPGATSVEADFDRLVQVLSNLLDNALRHTQAGSVEIRSRSVDDGLELSVSDTGVGIAEDDLERLFDRFWQPESRSGPGAGLGLAISPRDCPRAWRSSWGAERASVRARRLRYGCLACVASVANEA